MKIKFCGIILLLIIVLFEFGCVNDDLIEEEIEKEIEEKNVVQSPVGNRDPKGPSSHQMYSASSPDGLVWTMDTESLVDNASVPDPLITEDGNIRVYYLDFKLGQKFACIESADNGETFVDAGCSVQTTSDGIADPSIVQLDDGRYRLYFYGLDSSQDVNSKTEHVIKTAISDDGITFVEEQIALAYGGVVDPDVFWNGEKWIMTTFSITDGTNIVAVSDDGLTFSYFGETSLPGIITCQPVKLENGLFRVYGFAFDGQDEFYSYTSADGLGWIEEEGIRLEAPEGKKITDPQVVQLSDGTWRMYLKMENKITKNEGDLIS